ncbi:hypothetical protein D3C71_2252820 [compost metagenome]
MTQLILSIIGYATVIFGVGFFFLLAVVIWIIIDAFQIPGWIRRQTEMMEEEGARKILWQRSQM